MKQIALFSLHNTPLFHHISPFPPVLIVTVMLSTISSLNLVSPLGAWFFLFCTPQRQSSLAIITFPWVNHHQPTVSMADHLNALPDPPAPAEAQQELELIAEPAVAPAATVEVTLYSCFCFAFCRGYSCYVCGRFFFSA